MASFDSIINKAKKDWNCPGLMDGALAARGAKIPFSSPLLNYMTYGGVPRNKISIFYGNPSGGKTSTSVDICKNAFKLFQQEYTDQLSKLRTEYANGNKQVAADMDDLEERGPKKVLYLDLEHSFDAAWSAKLGLDSGDIEVMQPPDVPAEDILQKLKLLIESGEVGMVVIDSIPSLVPKTELEKDFGERTVAASAGLLTIFCRKMVPLLTRYNCTMILVNQIRENMDNPYVPSMPGGKALQFYASMMAEFRIGSPVDFLGNELPKSAENPAGYIINVKLTKQKSAPFDRKNASYHLMEASGIRIDMDFADLAVNKYQIIKKSGAWYSLSDPITKDPLEDSEGKPIRLQGMAKVLDYLQQNPEYFDKLQKFVISDIEGHPVLDSAEVENE